MKRTITIPVLLGVAALAMVLGGCILPEIPTAQEQVRGFLEAASATPQSPTAMRDYFSTEAADYGSMYQETYWDARFFNDLTGPYTIPDIADGAEDPEFPGSVTVTGHVTNSVTSTGYPAVFVLVTDPELFFAPPLIRKITVTVPTGSDPPYTDEVIENIVPR